ATLTAASPGTSVRAGKDTDSVTQASDALRQAREFMSEASGPPESKQEQERLTKTLHALEDASRLAEVAGEKNEFRSMPGEPEDQRVAELCAEAMRNAVLISCEVGARPGTFNQPAAVETFDREKYVAANRASTEEAMTQLEQCAKTIRKLQRAHRKV